MNLDEIKAAVLAGKTVHMGSDAYRVERTGDGRWLIVCANGHAIGLTWANGTTMNAKPECFYVAAGGAL